MIRKRDKKTRRFTERNTSKYVKGYVTPILQLGNVKKNKEFN